jgi:hypothetical protein
MINLILIIMMTLVPLRNRKKKSDRGGGYRGVETNHRHLAAISLQRRVLDPITVLELAPARWAARHVRARVSLPIQCRPVLILLSSVRIFSQVMTVDLPRVVVVRKRKGDLGGLRIRCARSKKRRGRGKPRRNETKVHPLLQIV